MANITNTPMAYITVNKGRKKIKQDKNVYLDNGTEFEIELHNPTQNTVLSKISINNKLISYSGIVLRPGERVYLERYLDSSNKFKFETYTVNGNSEEVKKAIELNGLIKVEFYNEDTMPSFNYGTVTTTWPNYNTFTTLGNNYGSYTLSGANINSTPRMFFSSTPTSGINNLSDTGSLSFTSTNTSTSFSTQSISSSLGTPTPPPVKRILSKKSLETGRVEKGSHSNQTFQTVNKKFHYYTTNVVEYHIKPVSQMVMEAREVNKMGKFCTKCGRKGKGTDNFCAGCGNRY